MEAAVLGVGKTVLNCLLSGSKAAIAEDAELRQSLQLNAVFLTDELAAMKTFLRDADEERNQHKVPRTWVKQVQDLAYDVEDCLMVHAVHLQKPFGWRLARTVLERHRIAEEMKGLRARVEDMSQRNLRYQLTRTSSLKPATVFGIGEARHAARQEEPKEDLVSLINKESENLRVIALWGTSGDLGTTTIINAAYNNPDVKQKFQCRAWIRTLHPFNPNDFIQTLVKQFRSAEGVHILLEKEKTGHDLAMEFTRYVNEKSYLIVLTNLTTFEEWNVVRACFPSSKRGSRIIVCASQVETASLCVEQESHVIELKQLSADQTIYAFYEKVQENQCKGGDEGKVITKSLTRIQTMASALQESQLIGREKEKSKLVEFLSCQSSQEPRVISVWGMGGLGKTSLVKDVYQTQTLVNMFQKRAFVTVLRPFNLTDLLKSLIVQLQVESSETKKSADSRLDTRNKTTMMGLHSLIKELNILIKEKRCLIVLDDVSSTKEWDDIIKHFPNLSACWILVTTREQIIAKHCSKKQDNICKLKVLEDEEALELFTKKVFKEAIDWDKHPELIEEAQLILKKCGGLPLAIVTIGGFLANQPKIVVEWRKLIEHISAELEMNPELEAIRTILGKSYDGLPYHLKSCFLYMSIFPEDHMISRRRLVRRWVAEGYSRELHKKSAEEISDSYFITLIDRSMILPSKKCFGTVKGIDSCQVHDLMRDISISKSAEENLVFRLEGSCSSNTQEIVRHLTINSNWTGDRSEFESAVDLSRIRSLTVFGKWRSFYISKKMRLLRVLDLESTEGLVDHHLEHIGSLVHLKYISLRECRDIYHLPDSWGNLLQLETLDIKGTMHVATNHHQTEEVATYFWW